MSDPTATPPSVCPDCREQHIGECLAKAEAVSVAEQLFPESPFPWYTGQESDFHWLFDANSIGVALICGRVTSPKRVARFLTASQLLPDMAAALERAHKSHHGEGCDSARFCHMVELLDRYRALIGGTDQ